MFRVVSYNIRAGLGLDGMRSIARIGDVLAPLNPDVICLQEVDQHLIRSWLANQPKYLSMRLGMQVVFQRNIKEGIGGYGNCILAKPVALHCRCHPLPGSGEPRGLVQGTVSLDGTDVTIFCTHLSTEKKVRVEQGKRIAQITRAVGEPHIVCGDFNDAMGSETLLTVLQDPALRDSAIDVAPTYVPTPSTKDHQRIDFVLVDMRFEVMSTTVVETEASDHRPVVVDLQLIG